MCIITTAIMAGRQDCAREGLGPFHQDTRNAAPRRHDWAGFSFVRQRRGPAATFAQSATVAREAGPYLDGLIPAVVQDHQSGEVLMVGFMNQEAWDVTKRTGYVTFFSRTRNTLWTKGETSGNRLAVRDVLIDCDEDTVLVKAERLGDGNVCHTGERTCFFVRAEGVTIP
jgi:phosphoribosyl-AMP cyclohydrolase